MTDCSHIVSKDEYMTIPCGAEATQQRTDPKVGVIYLCEQHAEAYDWQNKSYTAEVFGDLKKKLEGGLL